MERSRLFYEYAFVDCDIDEFASDLVVYGTCDNPVKLAFELWKYVKKRKHILYNALRDDPVFEEGRTARHVLDEAGVNVSSDYKALTTAEIDFLLENLTLLQKGIIAQWYFKIQDDDYIRHLIINKYFPTEVHSGFDSKVRHAPMQPDVIH